MGFQKFSELVFFGCLVVLLGRLRGPLRPSDHNDEFPSGDSFEEYHLEGLLDPRMSGMIFASNDANHPIGDSSGANFTITKAAMGDGQLGAHYCGFPSIEEERDVSHKYDLQSHNGYQDHYRNIFYFMQSSEEFDIQPNIHPFEEMCFNDVGVDDQAMCNGGTLFNNGLKLTRKVASIIFGGIIFIILLIFGNKKFFKSNNWLDASLIFGESNLDKSYFIDQILYENLLKEAIPISNGASGKVFKVMFLGLECAMKVFYSNARMDFRKESVIVANLDHPHIVNFFCSFRKSFIIMELMDADLYSFINKLQEKRINYDMSLEVALDVMLQIAEGMSYLHNQGIAHQDLKSLNILLKLRGEFHAPDFQIIAKIADFGSARSFDPRCPKEFVLLPHENIGTLCWKAPELFHPRGGCLTKIFGIHPRIMPKPLDIYGFAVICSELITKQIPFSNNNDQRVVLGAKIRGGHRPTLPSNGCPKELIALVRDCWQTNPSLRPEFHEICTRLKRIIEAKAS